MSDVSSRLQIISETQPSISSETGNSNATNFFLQIQQKQLLDLQRHFNNYVDTLPVFGFNSGKYDLNLIKAYLLPHLLNDRATQPTVIKKANQFISLIVGIVASQLYAFSICQAMSTVLYTRWEFDSDLQKFKAHQNKIRKFGNMVMSFYQATRPECAIESFYTTGKQKKN